MYDREYYAKLDSIMMDMWKSVGRDLLTALKCVVLYTKACWRRPYEYICDYIQMEKENQRKEENRFKTLKQNGHI